ncbi:MULTISPECIES: hypothetical protein [Hyphobacterium]|uniref:Short-chain dehydrogenase n=1 Tax=Hyphobacterium vulgare TaxID=1736751 RepID=A0ABV6ZZ84_9PROT
MADKIALVTGAGKRLGAERAGPMPGFAATVQRARQTLQPSEAS